MKQTFNFTIFGLFLIMGYSTAGLIHSRRSVATDEAKVEFERELRAETEDFFNDMFRGQIVYFGKVRQALPAETQRAKDIAAYIARLEQAVQQKDIDEKDKMWRDTFKTFNKSPLLLNNQAETGLSNADYEQLLEDNGLKDMVKNFLADVAAYFWKMAKASGKVVEVTIDEQLAKLRGREDVKNRVL